MAPSDYHVDPELADRAVAEHMLRIDRGEPVDREQFLQEYAEVADELREYFQVLDTIAEALSETGEPLAAEPTIDLPREFGSYLLLEKLGAGGMGQLYRAVHRSMERQVAVKIIHPRMLGSPHAVQRFQRETKAAARLVHPNIVTAYDAGEVDGIHFLAMELAEGEDLATLVNRHGKLSIERAVDYAMQAARGLLHAHQAGIVHRDVKPSNLLLDSAGTVKLLDLGLALLRPAAAEQEDAVGKRPAPLSPVLPENPVPEDSGAAEVLEMTGAGQVMGTADFMAPEQAMDIRHTDARAEVYELGSTLWYLLTGRPMYAEHSAAGKLLAHRTKPVPSLCDVCPGTPPALDSVFHRMVGKKPEERYQTMAEVIAALEPFCHGAKDAVRPSVRLVRPLVAAVAGLAVILIGLWSFVRDGVEGDPQGRSIVSADLPAGDIASEDDRKHRPRQAPRAIPEAVVAPSPPWDLPPDAPPPAIAPLDAAGAKAHQAAWARYLGVEIEIDNSVGMRFALIPPGEFDMGSTEAEVAQRLVEARARGLPGWYTEQLPEEAPMRRVRILAPFYLATAELTQAEYERVMGDNPSNFKGDADCPVEMLTWEEVTAFCRKLADLPAEKASRTQYRLPLEAEWEYACAAGTTTAWSSGDGLTAFDAHAWHSGNSGQRTHPVRQKTPNAWGLYDMHGNALEWCWGPTGDPVESIVRGASSPPLTRGGAWKLDASVCRTVCRNPSAPGARDSAGGCRVVRDVAWNWPRTPSERVRTVHVWHEAERPAPDVEAMAPSDASPTLPPWNLPAGSPPPAIAPFDAAEAKRHQAAWARHLRVEAAIENSLGMRFVLIPPGEFDMGSTETDVAALLAEIRTEEAPGWYPKCIPCEAPKRRVRITRPFYLQLGCVEGG